MQVPTLDELLVLLERLETEVADDLESEVLEIKPWLPDLKVNVREAVEAAACLANHRGGLVVLGIRDRTRGRKAAITGCERYDLNAMRRGMYQSTRPSLSVDVEELAVPEGTLLVIRVPRRPTDTPVGTSEGLYRVRVGKSCMPLDPVEWDRRQAAVGTLDWSALAMPGVERSDIDPLEVARLRRTIEKGRPESDLLRLDDEGLLRALEIVRPDGLTRAGFLLVGKEERIRPLVPQHEVIYLHYRGPTDFDHRLDLKAPLLAILDKVSETIEVRNPFRVLKVGLFHTNVHAFPEPSYREALLNALIHRNFLEPGPTYIHHHAASMVVSNSGGLVEGITPENFLHAPARARNRLLADIFQKIGLVERSGIGRQRLFVPALQFGKHPPTIEDDEHWFKITLHDGSFDERLAVFVSRRIGQGTHFDIEDLLVLWHLSSHSEIETTTGAELLQLPKATARERLERLTMASDAWLERRGKKRGVTYHLTREATVAIHGRTAYIRAHGIDEVRWPELVRAYVEQNQTISNRECRELLGLGNSPTAQVKAAQFLRRLAGPGALLVPEGRSKGRRYRFRPTEGES